MQIYLINLDRSTERRAHMEEKLCGLHFERIAAVEGALRRPTADGLTRFERACIDSHRLAWRRFLATPDDYACFLEDDLHFSSDFSGFIVNDNWIPTDAHAVKLDTFYNQVMVGAPTFSVPMGRTIARLYTRHESSAAYILSRKGAEYFLRKTENPHLPMDYILFPRDPIKQELSLYQLKPAVAIQDCLYAPVNGIGHYFASGIDRVDRPGKRNFAFKLRRETKRLCRQIFDARRYFANRLLRGLRPQLISFK